MIATRLLWIEFRRNVGLWFVLPILAVAWYLLDSTWIWTPFLWSDTNELLQKALIPFAGPAIAGAEAWMAGRDRRRGIDDLLDTTPMPDMARRVTLLSATVLWALLAYLVFAAYMLGRTALLATWGGPAVWPVLIVPTALLANASWGFLVGSILPSRFTAPLAAIAALGVELFIENSSTVTGGGSRTSNWVNNLSADSLSPFPHWQVLFYLGITVSALAALALITRRGIMQWTLLVGSIVTVCGSALMIWGSLPRWDPASSTLHDGWGREISISQPVQPEPVCAGQPVTVCTHPAWKPVLAAAVAQANELVAPLLGLPDVPLRVERQDAGLASGRDTGAQLDVSRYADRLVADPASMPHGYIQNEAQLAIRSWLLQRADAGYRPICSYTALNMNDFPGWPTPESCAATDRFAQLAPAAQRSWLEAHYADLRAGKLSLAELP